MGIQVKKFRGASLQKAIEEVRNELGDDAVILQTETVRDKSYGLLGRSVIEVTAAIDRKEEPIRFQATVGDEAEERSFITPTTNPKRNWWSFLSKEKTTPAALPSVPTPRPVLKEAPVAEVSENSSVNQMYAIKTFVEPLEKEIQHLKAQLPVAKETGMKKFSTTPVRTQKKVFDPLEIELQQLRDELKTYILERRYEKAPLPPFCQKLVNYWSSKGMSSKEVLGFIQHAEHKTEGFSGHVSEEKARELLAQALHDFVQDESVFEKLGKRVVVLVGPTGVGKTTTIAKIAAFEKMRLNRTVALISVDDYKIGGADQLAQYARIMDVPFIKFRPDISLEDLIKLQNADTIFVDTFGLGVRDEEKMERLRKLLTFVDPDLKSKVETHLTLPVGIHPADIKTVLEWFYTLSPDYLLFTKWDETENWGGMLAAILQTKKCVSLITHGQNVPDDISLFSSESFIRTVTNAGTASVN